MSFHAPNLLHLGHSQKCTELVTVIASHSLWAIEQANLLYSYSLSFTSQLAKKIYYQSRTFLESDMFGFDDIAQNSTAYTGMPNFLSAQTLLTFPL